MNLRGVGTQEKTHTIPLNPIGNEVLGFRVQGSGV